MKISNNITFAQAMQICEKRKWEYRRGYICDGWEWEVTPSDKDGIFDNLAGTGKKLETALRNSERNLIDYYRNETHE